MSVGQKSQKGETTRKEKKGNLKQRRKREITKPERPDQKLPLKKGIKGHLEGLSTIVELIYKQETSGLL